MRVAIVDDDIFVRRALARLLRANGAHVEVYGSAREFLGSLERGVPECLLVDLQMPEMSGVELQQHLASCGFHIPTIVITAHDDASMRRRCMALGATAYLVKPIDEDLLVRSTKAATAGIVNKDAGSS